MRFNAVTRFSALRWVAAVSVALVTGQVVSADTSPDKPSELDVIKATQNPLTRALVSISLENSFSFGLGADDEFGYGVLIKPSIPIVLSDQWSIINRSTLPVFEQPSLVRSDSRTFGLGDLLHTILLSPTTTRRIIWRSQPQLSGQLDAPTTRRRPLSRLRSRTTRHVGLHL